MFFKIEYDLFMGVVYISPDNSNRNRTNIIFLIPNFSITLGKVGSQLGISIHLSGQAALMSADIARNL